MKNYKKAKALRHLCGLTQEELGRILWSSRGTVSKWETSENAIRASSLNTLYMLNFIIKSGQLENFLEDRATVESILSEDLSDEVLESLKMMGFLD